MYMLTKKYLRKKVKKLCMGLNCDRKSQLSEILTESLNPREVVQRRSSNFFNPWLKFELTVGGSASQLKFFQSVVKV